jgi:hypothetical protein
MPISNTWRTSIAIAAIVLTGSLPDAALAGPRQDTLLQSYVGNWRGSGLLTGGDQPEKFSCRNQITDGGEGKINYNGRCAVAGLNLQLYGTVKYNDDANRYEGVMTSTTNFKGLAIGRQRGSSIVFDFKQQNLHEGHELTIGATLTLKPADTYTVDFDVWVMDSDTKMSTSVPFVRK